LSLAIAGLGKQLIVNKGKDFIAELVKFSLNLGLVSSQDANVFGSLLFFLLLNRGKGSPGGPS